VRHRLATVAAEAVKSAGAEVVSAGCLTISLLTHQAVALGFACGHGFLVAHSAREGIVLALITGFVMMIPATVAWMLRTPLVLRER